MNVTLHAQYSGLYLYVIYRYNKFTVIFKVEWVKWSNYSIDFAVPYHILCWNAWGINFTILRMFLLQNVWVLWEWCVILMHLNCIHILLICVHMYLSVWWFSMVVQDIGSWLEFHCLTWGLHHYGECIAFKIWLFADIFIHKHSRFRLYSKHTASLCNAYHP